MAATTRETGDAELVQATLSGNAGAFDRLVDRHFGMIYLIGYARLASREAAEDLAQEVFLSAYLNLHRLDPPGRFFQWLRRIAHNLITDWQRRDQRRSRLVRMVSIHECEEVIADGRAEEARTVVEDDERRRIVHEAIMGLHPKQRELVLLHYIEGLTKTEIARRTATHPSTVGRKIDKALAAMKGALEPVLRELAPAIKPPSGAAARTTALVAAVSAMSAVKRQALAETIAGAGKLAAGSAGQSGAPAGIGALFSSLKAFLTAAAKGASATSVKTTAATMIVAASLATGSVLLPNQGGQKSEGSPQKTGAMEFPLAMKTLPIGADLEARQFPYVPNLGEHELIMLTTMKPGTIEMEPDTLSLAPFYGVLKFGQRQMDFRLDELAGPNGGYDRLIIDLNGNGSLTDDRAYVEVKDLTSRRSARRGGSFTDERVCFGPIEIPAAGRNDHWRPRLRATAVIQNPHGGKEPAWARLDLESLSYLETTVNAGGVRQSIWLADRTVDLRITYSGRDFNERDHIIRDRDDSGICRSPLSLRWGGFYMEYLSPMIYFGPNPYWMTLAEDLSTLRLEPYEGAMGELSVGKHVKEITLIFPGRRPSDGEWEWLAVRPLGGKLKLPVGDYHVKYCMLAAEDDNGDMVRCFGVVSFKTEDRIEVGTTATTPLVCGSPLLLELEVRKTTGPPSHPMQGPGGRIIRPDGPTGGGRPGLPYLEMTMKTITGAGGERYSGPGLERLSPQGAVTKIYPRFRMLDEDGREVAQGEFKEIVPAPDWQTAYWCPWLVPKHLVGKKIRIVPEFDLGPIETTCKSFEIQL